MIKVFLHGNLGRTFGRKWELDAETPIEVFKGIPNRNQGNEGQIAIVENKNKLELYVKYKNDWHGVDIGRTFQELKNKVNKEGLKRRSTIRPAKITGKKLVWKTDPYGVDYISERAFSKKLNLHTSTLILTIKTVILKTSGSINKLIFKVF